MKKLYLLISLSVAIALLLASCGGGETKAEDKLAEVTNRGTLIVSSDPAYPPQSELVPNAVRPADTKCTSDQKTTAKN